MRLTGLELDAVGTFDRAVRIDGFDTGLNVLAGANELGKSTVFDAIGLLFSERHTNNKSGLKARFQPYGGGAPVIACTFELAGAHWRLEKQYFSAPKAMLRKLDGSEMHNGADAENRLDALLAEGGDIGQALPLLWVKQQSGFEAPAPGDAMRQSLGDVLARQAETTAGLAAAETVLREVVTELGRFVTDKERIKKNGPLDKAQRARDEIAEQLQVARRRADETSARIESLTAMQHEAVALGDPAAAAEAQKHVADLEAQVEKAAEARRHLKQLGERITFLSHQHASRVQALAAHDEGLAELGAIDAALATAQTTLGRIATETVEVDAAIAEAAGALAASEACEQGLAAELEGARLMAEAASRAERLAEIKAKQIRLDEIDAQRAEIGATLAAMSWDDGAIKLLRAAVGTRDRLIAQRDAGASRVRSIYQSGRRDGFRVDGVLLADGEERLALAPMVVDAEGIGRIEIVPGGADALASIGEDIATAEAEVAHLLEDIGAADPTAAEERESTRTALIQKHQLLNSERDVLAPRGREAFDAEVAAIMDGAPEEDAVAGGQADGTDRRRPAADIKRALAEVREQKSITSARERELGAVKKGLDERRTETAAVLRMQRTRRDELAARFAHRDGAGDPRVAAAEQVATAERALNEATREQMAWREISLSPEAAAALEANLAAAKGDSETRRDRLAGLRADIRHVEGMLVGDFEAGAGAEVADLEARLADAGDRLGDTEQRVAALRLLRELIGREIAERRDTIVRPLTRAISALACEMWPCAELSLNAKLEVDALARGGVAEQISAVSHGTREQIAVLARLGYAGLLADGTEALPVILDDPLAFSDDARLDALFKVMARAAAKHQIIVLTCHERAFEPLVAEHGAARLAITAVGETAREENAA